MRSVSKESDTADMIRDLSKRVDFLQESVSKITEAVAYLVSTSQDAAETEELKKKVELLSSYTTECIEHNDEVSFVHFLHRLAGTGKHGAEEGERPIEE